MSETPTTAKHVHGEAFRLMTYRSDDGTEAESIWNSRDGGTPFVTTLRSGKQATHVNWSDDRYAPDHKPKPGDRIFVDITQERAREAAQRNAREWWDGNVAGAQQAYESAEALADMLVADYFQPGAPDLIEVPAEPAVVTGPGSEGLQACDGHVVILPDPTTPSGYPKCSTCSDDPDTDPCGRCSALVLAVEAKRPCPDGGRHYEGVCVHYGPGGVDHALPSSPVVPSVGAVPVEVPEEWARAAEHAYEFTPYTEMAQHAWPNAVRALYPLIAARVRAEERRRLGELGKAAAHPFKGPNDTDSSMLIEAAKRIEGGYVAGGSHTRETTGRVLRLVADMLAAGSDVPVATPPACSECGKRRSDDPESEEGMSGMCLRCLHVPVATPTEPVDEVVCPNCEHTIRARMSDQPGPCTSECGKPADQTCLQWACRKAGADLAAPAEQDGQR